MIQDDDLDECVDSYEDEDDMMVVNDVTSQLAAAGWQNGVHLFFLFIFFLIV